MVCQNAYFVSYRRSRTMLPVWWLGHGAEITSPRYLHNSTGCQWICESDSKFLWWPSRLFMASPQSISVISSPRMSWIDVLGHRILICYSSLLPEQRHLVTDLSGFAHHISGIGCQIIFAKHMKLNHSKLISKPVSIEKHSMMWRECSNVFLIMVDVLDCVV